MSFKSLESARFLNVFRKVLYAYQFDQKYRKKIILWNIIAI